MYSKVEFTDGKGYMRNGNPKFYELLEEMANTHDKKSHDYASNENPSGNYHFAGQVANMFSHSPQDAGFVGRLAEKLYRIANLEGAGKAAKNESVEDTERDICVIAALWIADRRQRREKAKAEETYRTYGAETAKDATPDVEVYQLLGNIGQAINEFLSKPR